MGCLFGYCGRPAEGLLDAMGQSLAHRCPKGFEDIREQTRPGRVVEIGRGIPAWSSQGHLYHAKARGLACGYAGVFFNAEKVLAGSRSSGPVGEAPPSVLAGLQSSLCSRIPRLEGAFVLAAYHNGTLVLARDPGGIKVLYWTRHRDRIVFASEIKALFCDPAVPRRMRPGALTEYLTFSFVPGANTMFADVFELQPGSLLHWENGEPRVKRHFVFETREPAPAAAPDEEAFARRLRADLELSVAECCRFNSAPPAVVVSGGIDSSAVLALLAKRYPDKAIPTFSVHFGRRYANENDFVALITERYRTDHTWLEIRPRDFLKRMRQIVWYLDDPIGDPITAPNFLLAEAVSRVSGVLLNGEGGDPCFGGPKNIPMLLAAYLGPLPGEKQQGWLERNYLASYRKCFQDLSRMLDPAVWRAAGGEEALLEILSPFFHCPRPTHLLNRLMNINIRLKGANLILVKVDKMTSANGVLALAPLFSRRIIENSMACPPELKLSGSVEKAVLKQAVADIVPRPIVERPKSGMMVPVKFWFQGEMRRYAKSILSRGNVRRMGLFDPDYVRRLLAYDGRSIPDARYGLKLWMLITFMLWYEQMIEGCNGSG